MNQQQSKIFNENTIRNDHQMINNSNKEKNNYTFIEQSTNDPSFKFNRINSPQNLENLHQTNNFDNNKQKNESNYRQIMNFNENININNLSNPINNTPINKNENIDIYDSNTENQINNNIVKNFSDKESLKNQKEDIINSELNGDYSSIIIILHEINLKINLKKILMIKLMSN